MQSLTKWLKHHGAVVETLAISSSEPMSPDDSQYVRSVGLRDPTTEVEVVLPCTSLPKLRTLRLYDIDISLHGITGTTHNPLPSLTSLKACDSPKVCPYLHMLTSLKQLSLSDLDFPTGNLMRMATSLTQLTRLRLEWTGGCGVV